MLQKAEEFAKILINENDDYETNCSFPSAIELIRARDKAIIERCKELIMADSELHTMTRNDYTLELIDSVLREIE